MTEAPSEEDGDHTFEKAYSLYRLHREADASSALEEIKGKSGADELDRGVLHLEAQLVRPHLYGSPFGPSWTEALRPGGMQAYRQGSYQVAFDLYNQLLDMAEPVSGVFHVLLAYITFRMRI